MRAEWMGRIDFGRSALRRRFNDVSERRKASAWHARDLFQRRRWVQIRRGHIQDLYGRVLIMDKLIFTLVFLGMATLGLFSLRHPAAMQNALRLPPRYSLVKTPEQVRDLVRFTGAGFILVGMGGVVLTLLT